VASAPHHSPFQKPILEQSTVGARAFSVGSFVASKSISTGAMATEINAVKGQLLNSGALRGQVLWFLPDFGSKINLVLTRKFIVVHPTHLVEVFNITRWQASVSKGELELLFRVGQLIWENRQITSWSSAVST
jgi:hypothetical protein